MTTQQVVNKLSLELAFQISDFENMPYFKRYIQMALSVGIEHFTKDMVEIVALTTDGVEIARYKSVQDAAEKLGLYPELITAVLSGRQHTTGGYMFIKTSDKELIKRSYLQEALTSKM